MSDEVIEISDEVIVEDAVASEVAAVIDPLLDKVKKQINVASELRMYLSAKERFDRANEEFAERCRGLMECMKPNEKFVFRHGYGQHYLVVSDSVGRFRLEPIELI